MKQFNILITLIVLTFGAFAQPGFPAMKIPINRQLWHEKIEAEQKLIDRLDGKTDSLVRLNDNDEVAAQIGDALYRRVYAVRYWIETDTAVLQSNKVRYLSYTENFLRAFRTASREKEIRIIEFPEMMGYFENIIYNLPKGLNISDAISQLNYYKSNILTKSFPDAKGNQRANQIVFRKFSELNPDKVMAGIRPYVNEPFADTLISFVARKAPAQLYTFAQNPYSPEGQLIARSTDPAVQNIVRLSRIENPLFYLPFIDNINSGKISIDSISKFVGDGGKKYDSVGYYKLLVKTAIDYHKRMSADKNDIPVNAFGTNGLYETLRRKALQHFITPINELHNAAEAYRMRAVEPLTPIDLYYIMVLGENDIYTSSYRHSFKRMIQRMGTNPRTDSLVLAVDYDHFKKFIKMAANYNQLDWFLSLMPTDKAKDLMRNFVADLEKGNSLEDAVDVADSYSSITDKKVKDFILENIRENEVKMIAKEDTRGALIYGLLKTIFESEDTAKKIDLTASIGIPSIYKINHSQLADDKGRIVQQVFFYGDEDGKVFFRPFVSSFSPAQWIITPKKEWIEFKSKKGNIMVFANRPLDYDRNLDDSAQVHMNDYMNTQGMRPTLVVHRGHSYWLGGTMKRMSDNAKILMLGSCGGYQNLARMLKIAPDAHIISTKEIGTGNINQLVYNAINDYLLTKPDVDWKQMWASLSARFMKDKSQDVRDGWESYIPPYKNLGAIFIKAYDKKSEGL